MRAALVVLAYAVAVGWFLPGPLARLAGTGAAPRLGIAAWLAAMGSALASAIVALALLARAAAAGWPAFARIVCESVTNGDCSAAVYRSAAFELGLAVAALLGGVIMTLLGWRYGRSLRLARARTRAHAEAARIAGRPIEGMGTAFALDAAQPAAYCVPGRPAAIVLTTGALALLSPPQLAAVLAHERAHLAGRHHLLLAATRSLAAGAPVVPLFSRGAAEVARLAEMRADDLAARRSDRRTLLGALVAMGASTALAQPPSAWLAAGGSVVASRVRRLAEPPQGSRRIHCGLTLAALTLALCAASALVPALAVA
jgi:Zn-dependent protease with chaperone function